MNWTRLITQHKVPRSSHSLAVVGDIAYIFGGEIEPRKPVDNHFHAFNLSTQQWNTLNNDNAPDPRVGACSAAINHKIYIFGGRGGKKDLTVLPSDLYSYDVIENKWSKIEAKGDIPEMRSYHCMTSSKSHLYLFGGCGVEGRLNDFSSFNITTNEWKRLASSEISPRGGSAIVYTPNNKIALFGGYNGSSELDDFYIYDINDNKWVKKELAPNPPKRSVHGMCNISDNAIAVACGERDPSDLGHDGAGKFLNDVWSYNYMLDKWSEIETRDKPESRGWFQMASWNNKIVLNGGLDENNQRLGDIHVLSLDK
jgi:N-acetylneuraminic acid mutarotase